jgi:serine/threonine-protein kinase RsbW
MQIASVTDTSLSMALVATPLAVRAALLTMFARPPLCDLGTAARGVAELVLAEVLNNIAEHAYAERGGPIRVKIARRGIILFCEIEDDGRPMPEGRPPEGELTDVTEGALPTEGGYGWYLIRHMTDALTYARVNNRNCLSFHLLAQQSA